MKIRSGFVSNSSSSSFCMVGAFLDTYNDAKKIINEYDIDTGDVDVEDSYYIREVIAEHFRKLGFDAIEGEDVVIVGYDVELDTSINDQIKALKKRFEELGIKEKVLFDYGEISY